MLHACAQINLINKHTQFQFYETKWMLNREPQGLGHDIELIRPTKIKALVHSVKCHLLYQNCNRVIFTKHSAHQADEFFTAW